MTGLGKLVAVVVSITIFVMPAATMPLHCMLMVPSGGNTVDHCHMMGMSPHAGDQIGAQPADHSCCQISAARPESTAVPQTPGDHGVVMPVLVASFSGIPAGPVTREHLDWDVQLPGGPPQAVLCTFLI